jgi:putative sterol carrier protein
MEGLPGISTNLLAERLKDLEQQGLLRRRVLPPPAGSTVYELTPLGLALEKTLLELGKWGSQFVPPLTSEVPLLHLGSYALTHKTFFRPEAAQGVDETYELHIDDEVLQVRIHAGEICVRQGEAGNADVILQSEMADYLGLLSGQIQLDEAIAEGVIRVEGDLAALRRFLKICGVPIAR